MLTHAHRSAFTYWVPAFDSREKSPAFLLLMDQEEMVRLEFEVFKKSLIITKYY